MSALLIILAKLSPLGCFSLLTSDESCVSTLPATMYRFVPEYISSVFSSRNSTSPGMSTNSDRGTSLLVSESSKT